MKKKIHLFFRKPVYGKHFSLENFYIEIFKDFIHPKFEFIFKICPVHSKGILNRIFLVIWAFFNQGDLNHITGDINFISILLNKKKTINTILDTYSLKRLKNIKKFLFYLFWIKIPINKSVFIITISNKVKKEISQLLKSETKKINVIDLCVNKYFKKNIKKKIINIPNILIIGTSENKNINNILIALKNIKIKLIIVGILSFEDKKNLKSNNIKYKNYVSLSIRDLVNQYISSDIVLFISKYEGFGLPIIEAQSIGRAVITSDLEPMKHVGGAGALYVDPNNIKNIKKSVKKVISDNNFRNNLIKKGYQNVKRFNKKDILKNYLNYYEKI